MEHDSQVSFIFRLVWISDICIVFKEILGKAEDALGEMVAIRRHLHQNPELSFSEVGTADYISDKLHAYGLKVKTNVAGYGMIAEIKGAGSGPCIALRADMDALPILETGQHEYSSKVEGVMHACGHDAHSAMLLGAVKNLNEMRESLNGSVRILFQPAEEKLPGGASLMIKAGALKAPEPIGIIGQHVTPELDVGKIAFRSGAFMASADEIYLTIKGKGGHAAMPHRLIDPVLISSHVIVALQQIVSRRNTPWIPSVLSFGKVVANGATNVIPSEVKIEGTFRTFDEAWRREVHQLLPKMINELVTSMGGTCEVDVRVGYPVLINEENLTQRSREVAIELFGSDNVVDMDIRMGAEDFAFYSHEIPACFYRLGTGSDKPGTRSGLHTSDFDIDEDALRIGSALLTGIVMNELKA